MRSEKNTNKASILLINKDRLLKKSLYEMLCRSGYEVDVLSSIDAASTRLEEKEFHVILTEVNESQDVEALKVIKEKTDYAEIIVLATYGNLEAAVKSIKMGAFDYLVRPVEDEKIISAIERALASKPLHTRSKNPVVKRATEKKEDLYHGLIGKDHGLNEVCLLIERISNSKATILMQGESGTGKRVVAHAIHKADKRRRHKPFIEVSCGALPRDIIESELFGHVKGAFTGAINERKGRFELAHGGTLLLDDIDGLPLDLQVKLLRVLQQKEFERVGDHKTIKVDVRIIAATNQNLEKLVEEKKFREDLFYRLNVITVNIPPLRERKEDLPALVDHFISAYSKENHKKIKGISKEILDILMNYNWPGNIRELENIIERAVILDMDGVIKRNDLPEILIDINVTPPSSHENINIMDTLKDVLRVPEKVHILRVLKEVGWNKKKAATKLGVNRTTLYNKLRKYSIFTEINEK